MAPMTKVNLAYMHFTFKPNNDQNNESMFIMMKHDEPELSDFLFSRREFLKRVLSFELSLLSRAPGISFSEWRFTTNNPEYFEVCGERFDKMVIFLGDELVHWSFYMSDIVNTPCVEGEAEIPLTYCSCCLQKHYPKIVNTVREYINSRDIKPKILHRRPRGRQCTRTTLRD